MTADDQSEKWNMNEWENRSIKYGSSLKSVLFKGMPDVANEHFHLSHLQFIIDCLKESGTNMRILDLGCGYGRLSMPIIRRYPDADIMGMDISKTYVDFYKKNTGREAIVCTLETMPSDIGKFDFILSVTVLMYVNKKHHIGAVSCLLDHLNPNGKIIIIEPSVSGLSFQTGFGILKLLGRKNAEQEINTGGSCFANGEIQDIVETAGGVILKEQNIAVTTVFFLPIYILGNILPRKWAKAILKWIAVLDSQLKNKKLPTLWTFSLVGKK